MKKLIKIKLNLNAGKATANPPIGPILGQYGVNINSFCKEYNSKTQMYLGLKIPVSIIIFSGVKKISLKLHAPSLSFLISFFSINNYIKLIYLRKILNIKRKEFHPISYKKYLYMVKGTLKSMNIKLHK